MLHLLIGTDWTANRDEILRRISRDVKEEKNGRILMVPELISHETERRLCASAGDTASRFAECCRSPAWDAASRTSREVPPRRVWMQAAVWSPWQQRPGS